MMGESGWEVAGAANDGEQDPQKLAPLARGRLKTKREQLEQPLHGRVTDYHRLLLAQHRAHIEFLDRPSTTTWTKTPTIGSGRTASNTTTTSGCDGSASTRGVTETHPAA